MEAHVSGLSAAERLRGLDWQSAFAAALGLGIVAPVAAVDGGWAPSTWGWPALVLAWVALIALLVRAEIAVSRLQLVAIGSLALFALWTLLSSGWSNDAGASVLSFERVLVYLTALVAVTVALRAAQLPALVGGVWAASTLTAGYALLTRLYPDRFPPPATIAGNRLATPVGYWNSLGFLCAFGIVIALGLAASSRRRAVGAAACASVVPLVLALYFTFSRGGWGSLIVGVWVAVALDPRRLGFLLALGASLPWAAISVWLASGRHALTGVAKQPALAAQSGAQLARLAIVLAVLAAACGAALPALRARTEGRRVSGRAVAVAALVFLVVGLGVASVRYGSPAAAARAGWRSFNATAPTTSRDLNKRLFSFSSSGRTTQWRVAWNDATAHPLLGSGAGTYQREWLQHRKTAGQVVNAHNLYLETLAELGLVGLVLLLAALGAPVVAVVRARGVTLVAAIGGAYAAYLLHVAVDWDWQLPGVSLGPLLLAAGVLLTGAAVELGTWARRGAAAAVALVAVAALVGLVGNRAAAAASHDTSKARFGAAIASARRARTWAPWSARPWQLLGEAQLQRGDYPEAAASFRHALVKSPDDWRLWLDLALAETKPARRRAAALRALALDPLSPEIEAIRPALGLATKRP